MVAGMEMKEGGEVRLSVGKQQQHVVVIGAGFAGLSAACSLAKEGFKVTVLDRLPEVNSSSPTVPLPKGMEACLLRMGTFCVVPTLPFPTVSTWPREMSRSLSHLCSGRWEVQGVAKGRLHL